MKEFFVETPEREAFVPITEHIQTAIDAAGLRDGLCTVYVPHTTAGVTINEGADPDVVRDMLMAFGRIVPDDLPYRHFEGNSTAHIKTAMVGTSTTILIRDGRLQLGTWQTIYLCEFDGPRRRKVWLHFQDQGA